MTTLKRTTSLVIPIVIRAAGVDAAERGYQLSVPGRPLSIRVKEFERLLVLFPELIEGVLGKYLGDVKRLELIMDSHFDRLKRKSSARLSDLVEVNVPHHRMRIVDEDRVRHSDLDMTINHSDEFEVRDPSTVIRNLAVPLVVQVSDN